MCCCCFLEELLCLTAGERQQVPPSLALLTEADRKTGQIEIPVLLVKHHSCSLMQLIEQGNCTFLATQEGSVLLHVSSLSWMNQFQRGLDRTANVRLITVVSLLSHLV